MTVLALLTGADPAMGRSADQLMQARYAQGSYATFCEGRPDIKLGSGVQTLLKGLLNDDPELRWDIESLLGWCENPRMLARRSAGQHRALKTLMVGDTECRYRAQLPGLMHRHQEQAAGLVRSGALGNWLRREFDDKDAKAAIEALTASHSDDSQLVSASAIYVHPPRPLVYKTLSLMPEAIGTMVAEAFARQDRDRLEAIVELVQSPLPMQWISAQELRHDMMVQLSALFASILEWFNDPSLGAGIERCLYELNPTLTCQSPIIAGRQVSSLRDLVAALDDAVGRGVSPSDLVDRHVAAFMMSQRSAIAPFLQRLERASDDQKELRMAVFQLFARLQQWTSIRSLPNLTRWCADHLAFVLDDFRSEVRRDVFQHKMSAAAEKGDLAGLQPMIESEKVRTRDAKEFAQARAQYQARHAQLTALQTGGHQRMQHAIVYGQQVAAALGSFVLALTISYLALAGS
jgi:hypothetical protein